MLRREIKESKKGDKSKRLEPPWMNDTIKREIKERKSLNRARRHAEGNDKIRLERYTKVKKRQQQ